MNKELFNINIERAVLSSVIFEPSIFDEVSSRIKSEAFYLPAHQKFFKAMEDLHSEDLPIDEEFIKKKIDESEFDETALLDVISTYPLSNTKAYVDEILELHMKRELVTLTTDIKKVTMEEEMGSEEAVDIIQQKLYQITSDATSKDFRDGEDITSSTLAQIKKNKEMGNHGVIGVDTGFIGLNNLTKGFGKGDMIIIAARPAMGKCLAKETKVLMYSGDLKNVEDVQVGDLLMGDDSTPRKVLSLARGQEKMYWIRQNKGINYRVNESHILSLKRSRNQGKHKHGDVLNISVREYLKKSDKFKSNYKGYKVPVEFSQNSVAIEPYFLGLWLGDGRESDVRIANQDREV
ncbi:MAG: replicative DNA helicase, partial [Campylobacterales bacterium]|nr:replicative DNA helicase [Campylobacterales bacterium]